MKTPLLLFLFFFLAGSAFAQKNALKGRLIGLPNGNVFTMGIGMERMLNEDLSVQILFNRMGYDFRDNDGGGGFSNYLIPEGRYYFGKQSGEINLGFRF